MFKKIKQYFSLQRRIQIEILETLCSIFLFTKGSGEMTKKKKIRNIIYRVCGVGMVASFMILLLPTFRFQVWLTEAIALFFFAISFLTKADIYLCFFCDSPYEN